MTQGLSSPAQLFDAWAEVYDTQPNPLLSLEQRVLGSMLRDVRGLDVLDAGCGTGRWLQHLAALGPRSLVGVDISPEMLGAAARKLTDRFDLRLGNCSALPVSAASADLVLSSFVISYLDHLDAVAREIYRVARPGATVFLTDMHPETEAACNWKRSFKANSSPTQIETRRWSLQEITQTFQAQGFTLIAHTEAPFGREERPVFEQCGKLDHYLFAAILPAIYLLQLRKPASAPRVTSTAVETLVLSGGRCALEPDTAAPAALSIVGDILESIQDQSRSPFHGTPIDLSGYLVLPGLINAHDHLEFGLYPNIGKGPYQNAAEWARDIHANEAPLIAQHRTLTLSTCLWWGALRNLLCGVTTVCHHNPIYPDLIDSSFPVRVVRDVAWAHSLAFEPNLASLATQTDLPFILHAAEGVDETSAREIYELDRMQALNDRTVLVHALACTPPSAFLINQRRASVILCPTSNRFLFNRSPSREFIHSLNSVMLGSDSPLTAAGDLLDEIHFAHEHIGLDASLLYAMVTTRPAKVLRRSGGEGALSAGSVADLCVVRDLGLSPAETLATLTNQQIEMVMVGGRVQMVGASLIDRLPRSSRRGLERLEVEGQTRWLRAPIDKLITEAESVLGSDLRVGGKRVRRASAA